MSDNQDNLSAGWTKFRIFTNAIATVLVPAVLMVLGNQINSTIKEKEMGLKYTELALSILREPHSTANDDQSLRIWATHLINYYSGVTIPEKTAEVLSTKIVLPAAPATSSEAGDVNFCETGNSASCWEQIGFEAIISGDIKSALDAFTKAENIWPDYHNVSEIRKLLDVNQNELGSPDAPKWEEIRVKVASDYSWRMNRQVMSRMRAASQPLPNRVPMPQ